MADIKPAAAGFDPSKVVDTPQFHYDRLDIGKNNNKNYKNIRSAWASNPIFV